LFSSDNYANIITDKCLQTGEIQMSTFHGWGRKCRARVRIKGEKKDRIVLVLFGPGYNIGRIKNSIFLTDPTTKEGQSRPTNEVMFQELLPFEKKSGTRAI